MPDDPPTFWTAVAAITAIAFGCFGLFQRFFRWVHERYLSPILELDLTQFPSVCSWFDDQLFIRIHVSNRWGKRAAENVEIFLDSVTLVEVADPPSQFEFSGLQFLPIRFAWSHGERPVCDRIAGGASRLMNFGMIGGGWTLLDFRFEVVPYETYIIPPGSYRITFLIVASNMAPKREALLVTLKEREASRDIKAIIEIEPDETRRAFHFQTILD